MSIRHIVEHDYLRAGLDERPEADSYLASVAVAQRAAMRVAPVVWEGSLPETGYNAPSPLPSLRLLLNLAVVANRPDAISANMQSTLSDFKSYCGTLLRGSDGLYIGAEAAVLYAGKCAFESGNPAHSAADATYAAAHVEGADPAIVWKNSDHDDSVGGWGRAALVKPLWQRGMNPLSDVWSKVQIEWSAHRKGAWHFWIDWYEAALAGRPLLGDWDRHWTLLTDIATEISDEDWDAGPDTVNPLIAGIVERHQSLLSTPLAQAAVADFSFDALLMKMKAVGFEDDAAHLRDPERVRQFLDDVEELRDGLTDFADYAADARGQSNAPAVLQRAAEKMLEELKRTTDTEHLRARRVVTLGKHLQGFASEESKRAEIGETLAGMLDDQVALIGIVCRKHLLPSIEVLAALDRLDLGDIKPSDLITRFEGAIARVERADGSELVPLTPQDVVMLKDMLSDLRTLEASIEEGQTEKFVELQRDKFASGVGELGATIGKYAEKASKHADDGGAAFDRVVKWYRRWETLEEILPWLERLRDNGAG